MIKAFIEIPLDSKYKYELDKETNLLILDRPLNQHIPQNYGFIPETLAEDGDPLDVFVITIFPLIPGALHKILPMGIMICKDNGINDHKIIATLVDENSAFYWNVELDLIKIYLQTYKQGFEYELYAGEIHALQEIKTCQEAYMSNLNSIKSNTCELKYTSSTHKPNE
jgi:inorganic pyrophosphatase